MERKVIVPDGWPCTLAECPPGPFVTLENPDLLCFKSEYTQDDRGDDGRIMAYNSAGEFFCGDGDKTKVQPVEMLCETVIE